MFKITPVQNESDAIKFMNACSAELKEGCFVYAMTDCESGEIMGISQFEINDGFGYIHDVKEASGRNDFEAMFILTRQTMNFIDLCGVHICKASECSAPERLLVAAGFKKIDGEYVCNMTGMFDGNCGGHE